jgi:hypothetical protein
MQKKNYSHSQQGQVATAIQNGIFHQRHEGTIHVSKICNKPRVQYVSNRTTCILLLQLPFVVKEVHLLLLVWIQIEERESGERLTKFKKMHSLF